jgi:3'(2'), 5'-bisphosphate nucleotidase
VPRFDIAACADRMEGLTELSVTTAATILRWREDGAKSGVRIKADGSPVTAADEVADATIRDGLARLAPSFPIVSEEHAEGERPVAASEGYFLVDPLDGTREFIAGRDEFTVNIGLIVGGAPILGIVAAPELGLMWRGIVGGGAQRLRFSADRISTPEAIHARTLPAGELIVTVSRSHLDAPTQAYLDVLPHTRLLACGSSVKFCRLAEGAADHYPRLGPTHDWDVAAGHALLVAAGGSVVEPDGAALKYGTAQRRIPAFLAWGSAAGR